MTVPAEPKIYHITHVDNLPGIIANGGLVSDAIMVERGGPATAIGMSNIKKRRLTLPIDCLDGEHVGDFVPFYFCPRSVMLYVLHCGNQSELGYRDGQGPIVHLEADLQDAVSYAEQNSIRWAFTLSNAGAYYFEDRCETERRKAD